MAAAQGRGWSERWGESWLLLTVAAGVALPMAVPNLVWFGWGHLLLPGTLHLLTLGGLLSGAYLLQQRAWVRLYGPRAAWWPLLALAWACHVPGIVLLVWGFFDHDTLLAYVGGHYLVPTGVLLMLIHGWTAAWRRPAGTPRHPAAHLPGLGLAVAVSLGALLVMDARLALYGIYSPQTVLAHLLAGGFLFVLPQWLLPEPRDAGAEAIAAEHWAAWYAAAVVAAGGVLAVVVGLLPDGLPHLRSGGLAVLGALLVWLGLPPTGGGAPAGAAAAWRLRLAGAGRLIAGAWVLYAALRAARGAELAESLALGRVGVLLFLAAFALPELLVRVCGPRLPGPLRHLLQPGLLAGTALLVAGQAWLQPLLVRAGGAVWLALLAALLWHVWRTPRAAAAEEAP